MTAPSTAEPRPLASEFHSPSVIVPAPHPPPPDTRSSWLATIVIAGLAALTRFIHLGSPTDAGTPVFDEKHYAPQAWQMLGNAGVEDNPGYGLVVHPPVAKFLMACGEWLFGYNAWGWRFMSALLGTVIIVLIMRITRRLSRSTLLGCIAALLLICDGMFFVTSRVGMLDIFLVFFMVVGLWCLLRDRDQYRGRLEVLAGLGAPSGGALGPALGARWWRLAAGVSFGLAAGVKWSGLAYAAFFGLWLVWQDLRDRRHYGVTRPLLGTAVRDLPGSLWALAAVPVLTYIATWWPWLNSEVGTFRHGESTEFGADGFFGWVPSPLRALAYYHDSILNFHSTLTNSAGNIHAWESKPWTWPMSLRPMLYYYSSGPGQCGSPDGNCISAIMLVGTPALWWLTLPMLAWALWSVLVRRRPQYGVVLVGYAAGFLPWLTNLDRQMYFFYAAVLVPFLVIGLALVCGEFLQLGMRRLWVLRLRELTGGGAAARVDPPPTTRAGVRATLSTYWPIVVVAVYLAAVVTNFAWLWPVLTGTPISPQLWDWQHWLPSWS